MSFKNISLALLCFSVAGVAACTLSSGTVDDTGIRNVDPNGDDDTTADSGPIVETDAGNDAAPTCTPTTAQTVQFDSTCQACLATSCCTQLNACYTKTVDSNVSGDCNEIQQCYKDCKTATDPSGCAAGCPTADPSVTTEFDAIKTCATTTCASSCPNF